MNDGIKVAVISKVISTIDRNKDEHSKDYLLRLQRITNELSDQYDKNEERLLNPNPLHTETLKSHIDPNDTRI